MPEHVYILHPGTYRRYCDGEEGCDMEARLVQVFPGKVS